MRRLIRSSLITALLLATSLLPALALRAQQQPPSERPGRPASKSAAKAGSSKTSTDPIDR